MSAPCRLKCDSADCRCCLLAGCCRRRHDSRCCRVRDQRVQQLSPGGTLCVDAPLAGCSRSAGSTRSRDPTPTAARKHCSAPLRLKPSLGVVVTAAITSATEERGNQPIFFCRMRPCSPRGNTGRKTTGNQEAENTIESWLEHNHSTSRQPSFLSTLFGDDPTSHHFTSG